MNNGKNIFYSSFYKLKLTEAGFYHWIIRLIPRVSVVLWLFISWKRNLLPPEYTQSSMPQSSLRQTVTWLQNNEDIITKCFWWRINTHNNRSRVDYNELLSRLHLFKHCGGRNSFYRPLYETARSPSPPHCWLDVMRRLHTNFTNTHTKGEPARRYHRQTGLS